MRTKLLSFLSAIALCFVSFGQQWEAEMLKPDANFYTIQTAFNQEWANKTYVKGSGYKQFKRWENFWETRIMPDGSFPMEHKAVWSPFKQLILANGPKSGGIGNWSPLGPFSHTNTDSWSPGTGRVNCIIEDPNNSSIIYVGAPAGGIWKSIDAGSTWTPLGDELSVIGVSSIAVDPANSNIIYIATGDSDGGDTYSIGVLKSIDGGLTWNSIGGISTNETTEIIIDPTNSNILWLATNVGVLRSIDAGVSWTNMLSGNIKDIALKPSVSSTVYAVTASNFYVTTNDGTTWSNTTAGVPNNSGRLAIAVTPANNAYVYILSANTDWSFQGIYRSTNSGNNFTAMNTTTDIFESTQAWYDMAITASPTNENTVITGVINLWKSTNGGSSFNQLNNWSSPGAAAYTHADIHFLRYYNGNLYCGSDGGIYRSTNNGNAFTDLSAGLQIGQFYRLGSSQNDVNTLAGGLQDNGGYAYVGGAWKVWYGADGMEAGVDRNNSNIIYGMIQNGSMYRTTNGANTGNGLGSPESGRWVTPMQMDPNNDRVLAGYNDLHEYDYATGWNQISTFNFPELLRSIEIYETNSDIILVGTDDNIYKTTNGGTSFTDITGSLSSVTATITSIEVNPTNADEIWISFGGWNGAQHIYHTSDNGANWNNITGSLPNLPCNIVKFDPAGSGGIYVGTDIGVYFRDNLTGSWVQYMNNLPNVIVNDLEINNNANVIRAGTFGRGVWESGVYTISDNDIGVSAVISPDEAYCNVNSFDPIVTLTNYGTLDITTATIDYDIDGVGGLTYNWTGLLVSGSSVDITLPTMTTTGGAHTFNATSSVPNGVADEEPNNDIFSKTFTITLGGEIVDFQIIPDCWGSEISWEILDAGTQVISGGPYSDGISGTVITEAHCIQPGCYDFVIYDGYGDGMYGSQYGSCTVDGYYNLTNSIGDTLMELLAVNADYGSSENNTFCLVSALAANFSASSTVICEGGTVDFSDNSLGNPIQWDWSFPGGTPLTSMQQNPTGIIYNSVGVYDVQLIINDGVEADTLLLVDFITVNSANSGTQSITACDSYTWSANSTTYTSTGIYVETLTNVGGCDSIATLDLTINNTSSGAQSVSACDSYFWSANGQTYTASGSFTSTLTNAAGCDSTATLNLTMGNSNSGSSNITACTSYTWSATAQMYTSSGIFVAALTNVSGCDSTATLNLTITNVSASTATEAACNTYTWAIDGNTYTSSGMYTSTIPNAAGCDSVITLDLTIYPDQASIENVSACGSYTWPANGTTYTMNGSYSVLLSSINGCDSLATLNLTMSSSAATSQTIASCGPYTWSATGATYSIAGNYSTTLTSSTGCDSIVTLYLTINSSNSGFADVTACDSYTWSANGTNYIGSGSYAVTLTNVDGCDSIATLNLTINNSSIGGTDNVSACNSYTWLANGNTYSTSGLYSTVVSSSLGCDSTIMLDLIINTSNAGSATVTACDSYNWSANGQTYTTDGSYAATLTNIAGCDSVATLNLIVNASSASSLTITECDQYTWPTDGNTYSTSGNYVAVLQNTVGCDSVVTLDLTINYSNGSTDVISSCEPYTWIDGTTYTMSNNTAFLVLTNSAGCDSTINLDLTMNSVDNGLTIVNEITFEANAAGVGYQWLDCNDAYSVINGETSQTFVATSNGNYAVEVTGANCTDTSLCYNVSTVSLDELSQYNVSLYPNPTEGWFKVIYDGNFNVDVLVHDMKGKILSRIDNVSSNQIINIDELASGMYLVRLASEHGTSEIRMIKQ
ncbi:MAG: T9SS type A sorting domain-containing protein [Crocinitomicaceae bacterium]|nr:T9SS type A sorting domain-containing protein [Crocinitomicaceae bacterium]